VRVVVVMICGRGTLDHAHGRGYELASGCSAEGGSVSIILSGVNVVAFQSARGLEYFPADVRGEFAHWMRLPCAHLSLYESWLWGGQTRGGGRFSAGFRRAAGPDMMKGSESPFKPHVLPARKNSPRHPESVARPDPFDHRRM